MIRFLTLVGIIFLTICNAYKIDQKQERIINGTKAKISEFPFQVSIQIQGFHICGGSILSHSWILTAAHCIYGLPEDFKKMVTVVVGVTDLSKEDPDGERLSLERAIVHPKFNEREIPNAFDIALLKVKEKIVFNKKVQPVILPTDNQCISGEVQISGWGSDGRYIPINAPKMLQKTTMILTNTCECQKIYEGHVNLETNVCATKKDCALCHGDSGGPLSQNGVLVGVVSWGPLRCTSEYPAVFAKVSYFVEYIMNIIMWD